MCGIVGYIGTQQAAPLLLEGLTRLEHRGYDSAGLAVLGGSGLKVAKQAGRVRELADDGVTLTSDTDTEVLAHLIARSDAATLEQRIADALLRVEGTYGVAVA